jgi:hypothetical protein
MHGLLQPMTLRNGTRRDLAMRKAQSPWREWESREVFARPTVCARTL